MAGRSSSGPSDGRIAVGVIRKAHGVSGEASVEPWTDFVERFGELKNVSLVSPDESEVRPATIRAWRVHSGRVLLQFEGIEVPEDVAGLRNWTIEIPESEARALDPDEYFLHDLVGLRLVDDEGRDRGVVISADPGGSGILLGVERSDGHRFAVPFAATICTAVDMANRRMTVSLPQGLEEIESIPAAEDDPDAESEEAAEPEVRAEPELRVDVVTIFPRMFDSLLAEGIIARAIKSNVLQMRVWDLRDFATDRHRSTDDEAYGGGPGMVMLAEPVFRCIDAIRVERPDTESPCVIMTSPQGKVFDHEAARRLSGGRWLIILCGRYEGFDERIRQRLVDEELSIGDFVVSGGELPAMIMIDAIGRLIEGVVGNNESVEGDSFFNGMLDYPHYTRPAEVRGLKVPDVLLSGHAEKIRRWRKRQALRQTLEKRPDLLDRVDLDEEARQMLDEVENETDD